MHILIAEQTKWYIHAIEYYLAIKRNEVLIPVLILIPI